MTVYRYFILSIIDRPNYSTIRSCYIRIDSFESNTYLVFFSFNCEVNNGGICKWDYVVGIC